MVKVKFNSKVPNEENNCYFEQYGQWLGAGRVWASNMGVSRHADRAFFTGRQPWWCHTWCHITLKNVKIWIGSSRQVVSSTICHPLRCDYYSSLESDSKWNQSCHVWYYSAVEGLNRSVSSLEAVRKGELEVQAHSDHFRFHIRAGYHRSGHTPPLSKSVSDFLCRSSYPSWIGDRNGFPFLRQLPVFDQQ